MNGMNEEKIGHLAKLPIDAIDEEVSAEPNVYCSESELSEMLKDLRRAVDERNYQPQAPTEENPALSDDYIFDSEEENIILKDLKEANFVGKIKDVGKGAKKRLEKGLPQEYLYVFKYPCELRRRDADDSGIVKEKLIIYIKINNRKIPYKKVFIVSFHKNRVK